MSIVSCLANPTCLMKVITTVIVYIACLLGITHSIYIILLNQVSNSTRLCSLSTNEDIEAYKDYLVVVENPNQSFLGFPPGILPRHQFPPPFVESADGQSHKSYTFFLLMLLLALPHWGLINFSHTGYRSWQITWICTFLRFLCPSSKLMPPNIKNQKLIDYNYKSFSMLLYDSLLITS